MPRKAKRSFIHYFPLYGCVSTGLIYMTIGVIAILSFLKIRNGGADESSMLAVLNDAIVGRIFIWIILLGTASYITWRFYETVTDPYHYGKGTKGYGKRAGVALSTLPDIMIVYTGIRVLLGTGNVQVDGQPLEEREMIGGFIEQSWGRWLVIAIGVVVLASAIIQFLYGIQKGYKERIELERYSSFYKMTIHVLAWSGYSARGVILGITAFFMIKAGIREDPSYVVNTDKAFDFIGDHVGHVYFIIVAVGTICYGLFMMAQGIAYNTAGVK